MAKEDQEKKKSQDQQAEQTESLKEVAKRLNEKHERDKKAIKHSVKELDVLKSIASTLLDIKQSMALAELRQRRELKKQGKIDSKERKSDALKSLEKEDMFGKIIKGVAIAVAALAGAAAGMIAGIADITKAMIFVTKIFLSPLKLILSLAKRIKILNKIIVPVEKAFASIGKVFRSFGTMIGNFTAKISKAFESIGKFFRGGEDNALKASKMARKFGNLKPLMTKIFNIFKFIGRISVWITVIVEAFKLLTTSFKIFTDDTLSLKDKFIEFGKAVAKQIGSFFTEIGDFVKDMASWLFKKVFGEDNPVSKFLDSFNFTEMWTSFIDNFTQWIKDIPKIVTGLIDEVKAWWELFKSDPKEGIKALLRGIINIPKRIFKTIIGWFSPKEVEKQADETEESKEESQEEVKKTFSEIFTNVIASIKKFFTDTWTNLKEWFTNFDFWALIKKAPEKLSEVGTAIKDKITGAISSLVGLFTGDESIFKSITDWWDTFSVGSLLEIPKAIFGMIKTSLSKILGFFTKEKAEEDVEADEDSTSIFTKVMDGVKAAIGRVFDSVIDFFTNTFSFAAIKENMPDIGGFLKGAGEWIGNVIKDGINFIKNKINFFSSKTEEEKEEERLKKEEEKAEKERKKAEKKAKEEALKAAEADIDAQIKEQYGADALNWGWGRGDAEAKALKEQMMADAETAYNETGEIQKPVKDPGNLDETGEIQKPVKDPGNLGTAIEPYTAQDFASSPFPVSTAGALPVEIVGTGQEMGQVGDDLVANQMLMEENKALKESKSSGGAIMAAPVVTNNSSSTVNNVAGSMPSTRDYSDYTQAYRAAGTPR